jgi:hypothetical protein
VRGLRDPDNHARLRRGAIEMARRFTPERHLDALTAVIEKLAPPAAVSRTTDSVPLPARSASSRITQ